MMIGVSLGFLDHSWCIRWWPGLKLKWYQFLSVKSMWKAFKKTLSISNPFLKRSIFSTISKKDRSLVEMYPICLLTSPDMTHAIHCLQCKFFLLLCFLGLFLHFWRAAHSWVWRRPYSICITRGWSLCVPSHSAMCKGHCISVLLRL